MHSRNVRHGKYEVTLNISGVSCEEIMGMIGFNGIQKIFDWLIVHRLWIRIDEMFSAWNNLKPITFVHPEHKNAQMKT